VVWAAGEQIVITTAACAGDHDRVSTTYDGLASDVRPGDRLLVDDGKVELRVLNIERRRRQVRGPSGWSGQ
jgi:pyruvate kinase